MIKGKFDEEMYQAAVLKEAILTFAEVEHKFALPLPHQIFSSMEEHLSDLELDLTTRHVFPAMASGSPGTPTRNSIMTRKQMV